MLHTTRLAVLSLFLLGACASTPPLPREPMGEDAASALEYQLGTGDKVIVSVFGEDELSGNFEIDSSGKLSLPLIGSMQAASLTQRELETTLRDKLSDGYLKDPKVSVEIETYRPFFILGEVNEPGSYPYINGMTVLNAVAVAGGYTYRAADSKASIKRKGDETEYRANPETPVLPGDVVRIPERYF